MQEQENEIIDTIDSTFNPNADENADGITHLNEPITENETEKLQSELNEQKDKFLRMLAEFENYKRRTSKERIDLIQTAGKDIIVSLLDVLDDVDRAEKQLTTTQDLAIQQEGIQLIFNKIRTALFNKGLKPMESSVQSEFNVEKHEAITEIPAPSEAMVGKVIDEVQKGYFLGDKIVRFAKVVVGK